MKRVNCFLGVCLFFVAVSCSQQEPAFQETTENQIRSDENLIDLKEAVEIATNEYDAVFGKTRSNNRITLKGFEILKVDGLTRADGDETHGFYVLNFQNNEGFAIISADKRRESVYAISNEGELHLSDTTNNKGLNWYINSFMIGGAEPANPNPTMPDSLPRYPLAEDYVVYGPVLKGFMNRFHQREPYNKYCFTTAGQQALVGCGPLALGTVMGHYEWPLSYRGYTFDWSAMKSNPDHDGWSRLFEITGRPENADAEYGISATGIKAQGAVRTLGNMGYQGANTNTYLYNNGVFNEIRTNHPVIVSGRLCNSNESIGHMWVLDGGYRKIHKAITTYPDGVQTEHYYYHCVWGWNGSGNGFFYLCENTLGGTSREPDYDSVTTSTYDIFHIVYGFRPNK